MLSAWPLSDSTALKSILWEILFLNQLHYFSFLSSNSFSQPFFKSKFMKKNSLTPKKFHFRSGQSASLSNFWPGQRWSKSYQKNKIRFRWLNWQSEMNYSFFMNRNFEGSNLFCRVSVIFYFGFATFEIIKSDNRPLTFLPESINHLFFDSKSHFRLKNVLLLNNLTSIF